MAALLGMIIVSFVMIGARYFNWAVLSGFSDTVSLVLRLCRGCSILQSLQLVDVNRIKK